MTNNYVPYDNYKTSSGIGVGVGGGVGGVGLANMDISRTNSNYSDLISADSSKSAIYLGDGWCTFPDLDNFDSEKLLKVFTLKEKDSADSIWDPSSTISRDSTKLSMSALRQLEALFNLSQLLFGLSRSETVNYTFRDLQLRKHPHSFKKSGFKQLNTGRIDFYAIFEQLVYRIIEEGGLEVTLLMYKNPKLPMVRQKSLDLISCLATVPDIAYKIMRHQSWFLDHLLILIRDGDIVSDKIPALSVLIRLLKVMLTERMISAYMKLVDMQYIDCLVDIFENRVLTESSEYLPFFIKFEFITMQSLTVILGDAEFSQFWSDKANVRLLNYCMIVLVKATGVAVKNERSDTINHILYAEQHSNNHSLGHTIMTVTELLRHDENMKLYYRYHRPFKQLIIQLYKKYGAKSQYIHTDPSISYALNHLMRVLYIKNVLPASQSTTTSNGVGAGSGGGGVGVTNSASKQQHQRQQSSKSLATMNKNQENKVPRICSNPECQNEETKYKQFKECLNCNGAVAYCSSKCKKAHIGYHIKNECCRENEPLNEIQENTKPIKTMTTNGPSQSTQPTSYNRIYSSTSTTNYQKNTQTRRVSECLQNRNYQENYQLQHHQQQQQQQQHQQQQQLHQQFQSIRRDSSTSRGESNHVTLSKAKKLSKFASMNDNHRRNSLDQSTQDTKLIKSGKLVQSSNNNQPDSNEMLNNQNKTGQTRHYYAKHSSSMKESKSGVSGVVLKRISTMDEDTNARLKQAAKENHQSIAMDESSTLHFVRPLKTSTALHLPDLTRRPSFRMQSGPEVYISNNDVNNQQQANKLDNEANCNQEPTIMQKNSDSSTSCVSNASSVSSTNNAPTSKKFKSNDGQSTKAIKSEEPIKMRSGKESSSKRATKAESKDDMCINTSNHKRRHSATAAILTTCTTQMTTTTKTTSRYCEAETIPLFPLGESLFYHGKKDTINHLNEFATELASDCYFLDPNTEKIKRKDEEQDNDDDDDDDDEDEDDDDDDEEEESSSSSSEDEHQENNNGDDDANDYDGGDSDNNDEEDDRPRIQESNKNVNNPKEPSNSSDSDFPSTSNSSSSTSYADSSKSNPNGTQTYSTNKKTTTTASNDQGVKVQKYKLEADVEEEDEEVESERWAVNEQNITTRNTRIESTKKKNKNEKLINSDSSVNEDEQDRRSQFKVIKEFEKTLEFVKNASNLKVMPSLSINQNSNEEEAMFVNYNQQLSGLKGPQISIASLRYGEQSSNFTYIAPNENMINNKENLMETYNKSKPSIKVPSKNNIKELISSDEDDDSDNDEDDTKNDETTNTHALDINKRPIGRNLKGVNFIINNSIDSHMLTNSYSIREANSNTIMNLKNIETSHKLSYFERLKSGKTRRSLENKDYVPKVYTNPRISKDDSDGYRGDMNTNYQMENNQIDEDEFIDDEMSLFKNETLLNTNKLSDYKTFKMPLMPASDNISMANLQYGNKIQITSVQQQQQQQAILNQLSENTVKSSIKKPNSSNYGISELKPKNQIYVQRHNELKVFNNLNTNLGTNLNQTDMMNGKSLAVANELPKNSTPIFTDVNAAASLNAKHKHFLNARLDLTIAPSQQQFLEIKRASNNQQNKSPNSKLVNSPNSQQTTTATTAGIARQTTNQINEQKKPVFLVPQLPVIQLESNGGINQPKQQPQQPNTQSTKDLPPNSMPRQHSIQTNMFKTSTLKSNSNLVIDGNNMLKKIGQQMSPIGNDTLDVSKISALENATSTNSCVVVAKADMPKDFKKCLKDEIKKDKNKCIIQ